MMNRRQKLVQQQFLNNEKAVINRLEYIYDKALFDIDKKIKELDFKIGDLTETYEWLDDDDPNKDVVQSMIQSKIYQKQYQQTLHDQLDGILNKMRTEEYLTIADYLDNCYEDGFVGSLFDLHGQDIPLIMPMNQESMVRAVQLDSKISQGLYTRLGEDTAVLKKRITAEVSRSIATGASYGQTAKRLANQTRIGYNNAIRIARTEGHRIQTTAAMDVAYQAKAKGADILKQWDAALDAKTRESHVHVDGEIREVDEKFSNGLMYPGDPSGGAAEVVNCRCALLQRARWALDEDELQTLKDRAAYYGLDKSEQFDDFKKKYLKAVADEPTMIEIRTAKDARRVLKDEIGFDMIEDSCDYIDEELLVRNTEQLRKLENKFGVVHESTGSICSVRESNAVAYVHGNVRHPMNQNLSLCPGHYSKKSYLLDYETDGVKSGFNMPCALTDDELLVYTVTHEYGHMVQNKLFMQGYNKYGLEKLAKEASKPNRNGIVTGEQMVKPYKKLQDDLAKECYRDIVAIAKENNPDFSISANISRYGRTNPYEFFAECFANSQLSTPNELGVAMNIYLERNGLVLK